MQPRLPPTLVNFTRSTAICPKPCSMLSSAWISLTAATIGFDKYASEQH